MIQQGLWKLLKIYCERLSNQFRIFLTYIFFFFIQSCHFSLILTKKGQLVFYFPFSFDNTKNFCLSIDYWINNASFFVFFMIYTKKTNIYGKLVIFRMAKMAKNCQTFDFSHSKKKTNCHIYCLFCIYHGNTEKLAI